MENNLKFPKGFYWGVATSSHQVEGDNHNDWTEWEKKNADRLAKEAKNKWQKWQQEKFPEMFDPQNYISGRACDHYNKFEEDFDIAKQLGHNAHRFSIEWSRVEPEEGKFNGKEIEHYREVVKALRERGIEPFVTLWHWTLPLWISERGGWANKDTVEHFLKYVFKITHALNDVKFWITLNEPDDIYAFDAYFVGRFPPQKKSLIKTIRVLNNLIKAHKKSYKIIHQNNSSAIVGFANNVINFEAYKNRFLNKIMKIFADYFWNFWFFKKTFGYHDFIGCSYYHHNRINFGYKKNENKNISDIGWEICSEGIYHVLKDLKKYNLPIYITENGIADVKDEKRADFIKEHLRWIHKAISEGTDVRGYIHWSLLDNFEWDKGFGPRFGLVEMDYQTMERKIRPSALEYKKIIENNGII